RFEQPEYHRIEITGHCDIDFAASGIQVENVCPVCGTMKWSPIPEYKLSGPPFKMVPDSWDGSDLFRNRCHFPSVSFCTEKVLEIASKYRLTNFRFEAMELPPDAKSKGIPYLPKEENVR